jgi:hypothetical protein
MRAVWGAALLVLAVLGIYRGSASAYFFNDDFHWLVQTQSFTPARLFDLSHYDHFYRPVIEVYFLLGWSMFGCNAWPFHVASIALHLLTTGLVYLYARTLSRFPPFAFCSALFFAVQPGLTDAVTWIGAITDLLPVLWYVLTLWLQLRWLEASARGWYGATIVSFALCHLTHESAVTLLPMMLLSDVTFVQRGSLRVRLSDLGRRWRWYLPFALLLAAFLVVAYVVNSRSYLVLEGHYALGWHALPNILNYVIWLYVGERAALDYVVTVSVLTLVAIRGSARMRFAVAWILVTLLPVSFFTWDNAPRYLYLPAVGFAMLAADLVLGLGSLIARRLSPRATQLAVAVIVVLLTARFAMFAKKAADSFPARTAGYQRFVDELRRANPHPVPGSRVVIEQRFLEGIPELYREPAARVGLCVPDLHLDMR